MFDFINYLFVSRLSRPVTYGMSKLKPQTKLAKQTKKACTAWYGLQNFVGLKVQSRDVHTIDDHRWQRVRKMFRPRHHASCSKNIVFSLTYNKNKSLRSLKRFVNTFCPEDWTRIDIYKRLRAVMFFCFSTLKKKIRE